MEITETKNCRICMQVKPLTEFHAQRNECKACRNEERRNNRDRSLCKIDGCGGKVFKLGLCAGHVHEGDDPSPAEIEAMKLQIRRENGHDQQRPLLPGMARGA